MNTEECADLARQCYQEALALADTYDPQLGANSEGTREMLTRFVNGIRNGQYRLAIKGSHADREELQAVAKLIEKALAVDMSIDSNRRGGLPQALGLVSRKGSENRVKHRAVFLFFDYAYSKELDVTRREDFKVTLEQCSEDAETGFVTAKLYDDLTADSALKIYERWRDHGPMGP